MIERWGRKRKRATSTKAVFTLGFHIDWVSENGPDHSLASSRKVAVKITKADAVINVKTPY